MIRGRELIQVVEAVAHRPEEAFVRTCTGRCYYAAYLECRQYCEQNLGYVRTRSSREHNQIPRLLAYLDHELADWLIFLRTIRNAADYDVSLPIDTVRIQMTEARALARRIIARLDELTDTSAPD